MAPVGMAAPGPTNVVVVAKIPEGVTEDQLLQHGGGSEQVLKISFRPADMDGPGWALVAFASPELAKAARERMDGKPMPGQTGPKATNIDAAMGESLYGPLRRGGEEPAEGPWKEARTPTGQIYYYHVVSRQSSWTKPTPDFAPIGGAGRAAGMVPPPPPGAPPPGVAPVKAYAGMGNLAAPLPMPAMSMMPGPAQMAASAVALAASKNAATMAEHSGGKEPRPTGSQGPPGSNLFVYHIPNSWSDDIFRQHFEHFGTILSCKVQTDPDGRPRGFGFCSFSAPDAAQAAISAMHGFPVDGKHLKVQLKKTDEEAIQAMQPTGLAGIVNVSADTMRSSPY
eukprot:TRINITY_DN16791_c0_g1_i1.p1 TRINITY_DN16791_c0_g1~~TRINITY_DN16791_c0_g1_i1.p1  ORF type:complete len:339 (+),score=80.68 TRINITY_DN16791_c0_g1_i1:107-1123(+)